TPLAVGEPYIVRGHRALTVEVWPVAYDPSAGTVRLYRTITFRLRLAGSDMARTQAQAQRYASPAFETRLSSQLLNYNQGRPAVEFGPDSQMGYLIITADAYYTAMQPFATLRQSRGFDVTMVRCSDIGGCTTASNVKTYIQTAYDTWPTPPSYVLLVGDTDTMAGCPAGT
ncbi:MAG: C25 family cysteine peptidase, partial [Anaerolineae bacterium]